MDDKKTFIIESTMAAMAAIADVINKNEQVMEDMGTKNVLINVASNLIVNLIMEGLNPQIDVDSRIKETVDVLQGINQVVVSVMTNPSDHFTKFHEA